MNLSIDGCSRTWKYWFSISSDVMKSPGEMSSCNGEIVQFDCRAGDFFVYMSAEVDAGTKLGCVEDGVLLNGDCHWITAVRRGLLPLNETAGFPGVNSRPERVHVGGG